MDPATLVTWIKIATVFYLLTVLAIIDVIRKDFGSIGRKAMWGCIALFPFIGWLVYLVFGYRRGKKPDRTDQNKNNN